MALPRNIIWYKPLLIALIAFLVANNTAWQLMDAERLHWDNSIHQSESLDANRTLVESENPLTDLFFFIRWHYPPLVSWSTIPLYQIFGEGSLVASFAITGFLVVMILATYGLGRQLFDERVGLLGALFVSAFPIVLDLSRQFMLDLPLASMTVLSLYLLVRSGEFSSPLWSLLLGVSLGCGMLTKWTFAFFLVYPFLFVGASVFLKEKRESRRIRNLILCLLAASATGLPWYAKNIVSILSGKSNLLAQGDRALLHSVFYYCAILPQQVSWLLVIPLILGLAFYVRRYRLEHLVPVLSIVGGYALLSFVVLKTPRFSIPLLPPFAILSSAGIIAWVNASEARRTRRFQYLGGLCMLALAQNVAITYVCQDSKVGKVLSSQILAASIVPFQRPANSNWQQEQILDVLSHRPAGLTERSRDLLVIPDHLYFNWATFEYIVNLRRLPMRIVQAGTSLVRSDYVVVKTGDLGEDIRNRQRLTNIVLVDTLSFEALRRFPLPDGTEAILLRRKS